MCIRQDLVSTGLLCYCDCIGLQAQHPNSIKDEREKSERDLPMKVCVFAQPDVLFRQVVTWENNTGFEDNFTDDKKQKEQ